MTQEEFTNELDKKGYSYEIEGDQIVVTYGGNVDLRALPSISPDVKFENGGFVHLNSLTSLPPGAEFSNGGDVYFSDLTSLPPGVEFRNKGHVYLNSPSISPDVVFKNRGDVYLKALEDWFGNWKGNMEGIASKRLLNAMIKRELFI
jgi:hypothetical protein